VPTEVAFCGLLLLQLRCLTVVRTPTTLTTTMVTVHTDRKSATTISCLIAAAVLSVLCVRQSDTDGHADGFVDRIVLHGPKSLTNLEKATCGVFLLLAFDLLDYTTNHIGSKCRRNGSRYELLFCCDSLTTRSFYVRTQVWLGAKEIPVRGKHLDDLSYTDHAFIGISKLATVPFVYFYARFCFQESNVVWGLGNLSVTNSLLAVIALFTTYDFFYTILHLTLHVQSIYPLIHKHHHKQKAPSRANVDAVNVHPVEYFLGEYNLLWALYLCTRLIQVHIITTILFMIVGGILAGINHTRFDVVLAARGFVLYDSKSHDVHHRIPQCNYGQYSVFWDKVLYGSYRCARS
jgi:sterol desaturase/sphingolipid hydroxylase (fatty acid hydroxylase superfamily)